VKLTADEKRDLEARVAEIGVVGERYTPEMMALVQR
jgi:hypothetical protein